MENGIKPVLDIHGDDFSIMDAVLCDSPRIWEFMCCAILSRVNKSKMVTRYDVQMKKWSAAFYR